MARWSGVLQCHVHPIDRPSRQHGGWWVEWRSSQMYIQGDISGYIAYFFPLSGVFAGANAHRRRSIRGHGRCGHILLWHSMGCGVVASDTRGRASGCRFDSYPADSAWLDISSVSNAQMESADFVSRKNDRYLRMRRPAGCGRIRCVATPRGTRCSAPFQVDSPALPLRIMALSYQRATTCRDI